MACYCAISKLEEILQKMQSGDISILDLRIIEKARLIMKKLCSAACMEKEEQIPHHSHYDNLIEQNLRAYGIFKKKGDFLLQLCYRLSDVTGEVHEKIVIHVSQ